MKPGDFIIMYNESLKKQWLQKCDNRWLGLYIVEEVHNNGSYSLKELDRTPLRTRIAGKCVKLFKCQTDRGEVYNTIKEEELT